MGSFKTVYMAFDREAGTQLAWNQIVLNHNMGAEEFKRIYKEISILKQISHPNIIRLFDSWIDEEHGNLIFITEAMTSGTLSQFRKRLPVVSLGVVQSWAKQLLSGLDYLHTRNPVIIHRDMKSNNIFMDATSDANRVKIGDLGLATLYMDGKRTEQMSVIGTPEYMAPEFYTESYNQLVDIWAFGLVMLEMVSNKVPYYECNGATAQIFLKVSRGVLPGSFAELRPGLMRDFIAACLLPASVRPSAAQLLQAPFVLQKLEGTTDTVYAANEETGKSPGAGRVVVAPASVGLLPSPRDTPSSGGATPTPGGGGSTPGQSPQSSPVSARPGGAANVVENTTQNLTKLAQQGSGLDTAPTSESGGEETSASAKDVQGRQSSPVVGTDDGKTLRASPEGRAKSPAVPGSGGSGGVAGQSASGVQAPKPVRVSAPAAPVTEAVKHSETAAPAMKSQKQSVDAGRRQSQDRGLMLASGDKIVPLSLVVNGVEGDRLSMCLTALRLEQEGVHEKKVNFVFDVSGDHVAEDAEGLVQANKPEFDLNVAELTELLGRRVAENMHLTNSGKRLRLAPSPVMPQMFERVVAPPPVQHVASSGIAANLRTELMSAERAKSAPDLAADIDQRRQHMLEKFASESRSASDSRSTGSVASDRSE